MKCKEKISELEKELKRLFDDDDAWKKYVEETEQEIGNIHHVQLILLYFFMSLHSIFHPFIS